MMRLRRAAVPVALAALGLQACGGGSSSGRTQSTPPPQPPPVADTAMTGLIEDGPVRGAAVTARSSSGNVLATATSAQDAAYTLTLTSTSEDFPLMLIASGGVDMVTGAAPAFELRAPLLQAGLGQVLNANPFTTLIARGAAALPSGITPDTVDTLRTAVFAHAGFGLTPQRMADPMSTPVDAANAAYVLRACESLAQTARRTHELLLAASPTTNLDDVMEAIAADLADGVLDGAGDGATDVRTTAAWKLASSQVLLESLTNSLWVDGALVTDLMDAAIVEITGNPNAATTGTITLDAASLAQWQAAVAAAAALASGPALTQLARAIASLTPGMTAEAVAAALPGNAATIMDSVLPLFAAAEEDTLSRVAGDNEPLLNGPPQIQGTPATSVTRGQFYEFTPVASDPDGDALVFSVENAPGWASFDVLSGRLFGTPDAGDAGVHVGISIAVSDGAESAALPAFDITVVEPANGSARLSWTPPTQNADQTTLQDLAGYHIYYSTTPESFDVFVDVPSPDTTSFVLDDLAPTTWHFVITAYDLAGNESAFSNPATKTVN